MNLGLLCGALHAYRGDSALAVNSVVSMGSLAAVDLAYLVLLQQTRAKRPIREALLVAGLLVAPELVYYRVRGLSLDEVCLGILFLTGRLPPLLAFILVPPPNQLVKLLPVSPRAAITLAHPTRALADVETLHAFFAWCLWQMLTSHPLTWVLWPSMGAFMSYQTLPRGMAYLVATLPFDETPVPMGVAAAVISLGAVTLFLP
jgi:hypothetical protein